MAGLNFYLLPSSFILRENKKGAVPCDRQTAPCGKGRYLRLAMASLACVALLAPKRLVNFSTRAGGVDELLLAGEKGMARRANAEAQVLLGGAGCDRPRHRRRRSGFPRIRGWMFGFMGVGQPIRFPWKRKPERGEEEARSVFSSRIRHPERRRASRLVFCGKCAEPKSKDPGGVAKGGHGRELFASEPGQPAPREEDRVRIGTLPPVKPGPFDSAPRKRGASLRMTDLFV